MALTVGVNSWSTISEANNYLSDRLDTSDWFSLPDTAASGNDSKSTFLVSAFYWLSGSTDLSILPTNTTTAVKNAQAEAAMFLLQHYKELDARRAAMSTGVTEFEISKRRETLDINNLMIPNHIIGILPGYSTRHGFVTLKGEYDV